MVEKSDETLVRRSAMGDQRAFVELLRRYEQPIATLIRYSIDNADDAQDVMQEVLLQAWVGICRVYDLRSTARASIHDMECVEIEVDEWHREAGWKPGLCFYGRVREETVQWMAAVRKGGVDGTQIRTFLDEGFVWAFPEMRRLLQDEGVYEPCLMVRSSRDCPSRM